jgi:hypothetical protein
MKKTGRKVGARPASRTGLQAKRFLFGKSDSVSECPFFSSRCAISETDPVCTTLPITLSALYLIISPASCIPLGSAFPFPGETTHLVGEGRGGALGKLAESSTTALRRLVSAVKI